MLVATINPCRSCCQATKVLSSYRSAGACFGISGQGNQQILLYQHCRNPVCCLLSLPAAVAHFDARSYDTAIRLFEAAYTYACASATAAHTSNPNHPSSTQPMQAMHDRQNDMNALMGLPAPSSPGSSSSGALQALHAIALCGLALGRHEHALLALQQAEGLRASDPAAAFLRFKVR